MICLPTCCRFGVWGPLALDRCLIRGKGNIDHSGTASPCGNERATIRLAREEAGKVSASSANVPSSSLRRWLPQRPLKPPYLLRMYRSIRRQPERRPATPTGIVSCSSSRYDAGPVGVGSADECYGTFQIEMKRLLETIESPTGSRLPLTDRHYPVGAASAAKGFPAEAGLQRRRVISHQEWCS